MKTGFYRSHITPIFRTLCLQNPVNGLTWLIEYIKNNSSFHISPWKQQYLALCFTTAEPNKAEKATTCLNWPNFKMDLGEHGIRAHCDITKGRLYIKSNARSKGWTNNSQIMLLENVGKAEFRTIRSLEKNHYIYLREKEKQEGYFVMQWGKINPENSHFLLNWMRVTDGAQAAEWQKLTNTCTLCV